jgi:hypothetical protein
LFSWAFTDQVYVATIVGSDKATINVAYNNIPSGKYRLFVLFNGDIGYAQIQNTVNREIVISLENLEVANNGLSSYLGGGQLQITGTQFPSTDYFNKCVENSIRVCGRTCLNVQSSGDSLTCTLPEFLTSNIQSRYDLQSPQKLTILDTLSNLNRKDSEIGAFDGKTSTIYDSRTSNSVCFIGARVADEAFIAQITRIRFFPRIGGGERLCI